MLFTQWSIRFTSRYNVTLFLSISMIFLHSSAIACSSSHNFTCPGFTVNRQKTARKDHVRPGMGKHLLQRATLKILLLPRAACSYYIYCICNRFENLKKVLHELPQNEGHTSHFRLSKNAVSNETCGKNFDNSHLIDKITLSTVFQLSFDVNFQPILQSIIWNILTATGRVSSKI